MYCIVVLSTWLNYGGAETQIFRLSQSLQQRGWKVYVISMRKPEAYADELRASGVEVLSLDMRPGLPDPRAVLRCVRLLRQIRPAVVLSFMFHANLLARLAARVARVPVSISSIRNENFGGPKRDRLMALTDGWCDLTTTNSHIAAQRLSTRGVTPAGRLRVVPNGLQTEKYVAGQGTRARVRADLGVPEGTFLWLAVGRLEEQKDYPTLLRAVAGLAGTPNEFRVAIAGQGAGLPGLQALASALQVQHLVRFLGVRKDVPELMAASDALVLSSAWEGLPNVVIEAHAAGLPVVSTDVGGVREIVEHGESGLVVASRDQKALAQAMAQVMGLGREERGRMGQRGSAHVESHFALERVVGQWETLFFELMGRKGVQP